MKFFNKMTAALCALMVVTMSTMAIPAKNPVQFIGNYLHLKSMMPCQMIILLPKETASSNTVSPFSKDQPPMKLKLVIADNPKPGKEQVLQEFMISSPYPSYRIYFNNAGGPGSTAHYRLYAENESGSMMPLKKYFDYALAKTDEDSCQYIMQGAMIMQVTDNGEDMIP